MKLTRILVPTDFSKFSLQALDDAVDLGKQSAARILVLHCLEPVYFASTADMYGPGMNVSMLIEEQRRSAQQQLARIKRDLEKRRVAVQTLIESGPAAFAIIDTAKRQRVDLIVMSTHGRSGLSHLFMGSVAERVVRGASCPVLTVRAAKSRRAATGKGRKRS